MRRDSYAPLSEPRALVARSRWQSRRASVTLRRMDSSTSGPPPTAWAVWAYDAEDDDRAELFGLYTNADTAEEAAGRARDRLGAVTEVVDVTFDEVYWTAGFVTIEAGDAR